MHNKGEEKIENQGNTKQKKKKGEKPLLVPTFLDDSILVPKFYFYRF